VGQNRDHIQLAGAPGARKPRKIAGIASRQQQSTFDKRLGDLAAKNQSWLGDLPEKRIAANNKDTKDQSIKTLASLTGEAQAQRVRLAQQVEFAAGGRENFAAFSREPSCNGRTKHTPMTVNPHAADRQFELIRIRHLEHATLPKRP
jgi:hypothetical protein